MPRVFLVSFPHSCGAHNVKKVYVAFILFTPFEKPIFREVNFKEENFLEHQFCEKVVFLEDDKKCRAMHKRQDNSILGYSMLSHRN